MTTKVLPYNRAIVGQETGYWCGPASAQMALSARNKFVDEATLARECRTTVNGTDNVGLIERVLDVRLPEGQYTSVYPGGERIGSPARPAAERKTRFWWDLIRSIDNGYGVVMNWVAPPGNKPRGVKGSATPRYGGGTTYHYVTAMGWSDDDGLQAIWVADSGFWPYGYWISFDQCFSLIHSDLYKGYAFANLPVIAPAPPGSTVPPGIPVGGATPAPPPPPPPPPVVPPPPAPPSKSLADPKTRSIIIPNSYRPRGMPTPMWIAIHTSESGSTAANLTEFCRTHEVSYHRIGDDRDIVEAVRDEDAPWAAVGANKYAYHYCFSHSFASWSRDRWLDPNPNDGHNEDKALTNGARQVAYWIQKSRNDNRPIPPVWIGNHERPPWGLTGVCGHVDFGQWGGGHSDPGVNFPVQEFLRRVHESLGGVSIEPPAPLPPVVVPGTNPDKYAGVMLWKGNPNNNIDQVKMVQAKLKGSYEEYAGHLVVDGDFGPLTYEAVREFQRRSGLVSDGIVGPMTAAALKPW